MKWNQSQCYAKRIYGIPIRHCFWRTLILYDKLSWLVVTGTVSCRFESDYFPQFVGNCNIDYFQNRLSQFYWLPWHLCKCKTTSTQCLYFLTVWNFKLPPGANRSTIWNWNQQKWKQHLVSVLDPVFREFCNPWTSLVTKHRSTLIWEMPQTVGVKSLLKCLFYSEW